MKQRFQFEKNLKKETLNITESGEVDSGVFLVLHEEEYAIEDLQQSIKDGEEAFFEVLRRKNFFPIKNLAAKFYEATANFLKDANQDKILVEYDDAEAFPQTDDFFISDDDVEIEALLEEDGDTKEDEIKEIDSEDDTPRFTPEDISEHEN